MSTDYSNYKPQKSIDVSTIYSMMFTDEDYSFPEIEINPENWIMIYVEYGEFTLVAEQDPTVLYQGDLYFYRTTTNTPLQLKRKHSETSRALILSFKCASSAMHFFSSKKIQTNISTKLHISTMIYEISYTRYLPFNTPEIVGFKALYDKPLWAGDQTVMMRLELMLIEIIREDNTFKKVPSTIIKKDDIQSDDLCLKVIEYMELHINEKLSMEALSRSLSFSKSYISRRFASTYGCSIIDYFNQMKLDEAKRLIKDTNKNFFEISDMLMFSNSHYFSTLFKKHTGLTPTQYKKVCIANTEEENKEQKSKAKHKSSRAKAKQDTNESQKATRSKSVQPRKNRSQKTK